MTEEDFLKRWSRRKRQVADSADPGTGVATPVFGPLPDGQTAGEKNEEPEFDPASLPPVDSITAVSDITAFLRAGVPAELTRAALRRVWTTDPAIRDFVGLAENAWDFTDPNAMLGFGPLESTEQVRQMIAKLVDGIGRAAQPPVTAENVENSNNSSEVAQTEDENEGAPQTTEPEDPQREGAAQNLGDVVLVQGNRENIATQRDPAQEQRKVQQLPYRTHGRALPR